MNERIRLLAEQAGVYEGVFTKHGGVPCDLKGYSMLPDEMAKFAQLIVAECVSIAQSADDDSWKLDGKGTEIARNIQQHFGVRE